MIFFPDRLIFEGRQEILHRLQAMEIQPIIVDEQATKLGAVETWALTKVSADHFKKHAKEIDGILVTLPNFSDEKAS